jgi:membrane fusion protein, macrolide-specific efflux system
MAADGRTAAARPLVALALAGLAALSGCFLFPKEEDRLAPPLVEPAPVVYQTWPVKRGTIVDDFVVSASFGYARQSNVFFEHRSGRLASVKVESGQKVKAGDLLAEMDTEELRYEIALQDLTVQKAKLLEQRATLLGPDRIQQQVMAIESKQAELTLGWLRSQLANAQLVSPVDGVVVYVTSARPGDLVDAYSTIVRVADTRSVELSYDGDRASSFTYGMPVEISYAGRTLAGTVVQTPSNAPADVPADRRSRIVFSVKSLPANAAAGELATVRAELQRRTNVLVIPRRLVQTSGGQDFVNVLSSGVRRQVPVQVGIRTDTDVEIRKGLSEGDTVVEW